MSNIYLNDKPDYPKFTKEMRATHKILVPQMAPIHFKMIVDCIAQEGYDIEILENDGPSVVHEGLQYVHNDACYPALLVIGQFIDALKSGKYDPDKTVLVITQTGGGCRASNYLHLLRKALIKAGFPQVPVASINASNLEKDSGLYITWKLLLKAMCAVLYGDLMMALYNQVKPYEDNKGETDEVLNRWLDEMVRRFSANKGIKKRQMKAYFAEIARDFAAIPMTKKPKHKVGIVGEIYVKYSPLGNNQLERFLMREDCEVNMPGLLGFLQYCVINNVYTIDLYGGSKLQRWALKQVMNIAERRENMIGDAIRAAGLRPPGDFKHTRKLAERFISPGVKMGEGWLLTGEMAELVESGFTNVVCAQPFGCLPNHIVGRGMINKIRTAYPEANITPIDYDPSATRVNQENRLKLMLASSKKTG